MIRWAFGPRGFKSHPRRQVRGQTGVSAYELTGHNLLVTTDLLDQRSVRRLSKYAKVFIASALDQRELERLLPSFDCMMIFAWPGFLTKQRVVSMHRLRFIQSILAGVNHIPFSILNERTFVCSNAGAYSDGVTEHAWGLLLASAKRIVEQHALIQERRGVLVKHGDAAKGIRTLRGKTLGILGYGGIGNSVARIAHVFGMKVCVFSRTKKKIVDVQAFRGENGLRKVLERSDAVVLSLPLTKLTAGIIDKQALSRMKKNAILVNIARGELVEEKAIFEHLKASPGFRYTTDVWWYRDGRESLATNYPLAQMPNFVGTLHTSGPSALEAGRPVVLAVENTLRFLKNLRPRNVVDPSEYLK